MVNQFHIQNQSNHLLLFKYLKWQIYIFQNRSIFLIIINNFIRFFSLLNLIMKL
jgi:hypothetical protein